MPPKKPPKIALSKGDGKGAKESKISKASKGAKEVSKGAKEAKGLPKAGNSKEPKGLKKPKSSKGPKGANESKSINEPKMGKKGGKVAKLGTSSKGDEGSELSKGGMKMAAKATGKGVEAPKGLIAGKMKSEVKAGKSPKVAKGKLSGNPESGGKMSKISGVPKGVKKVFDAQSKGLKMAKKNLSQINKDGEADAEEPKSAGKMVKLPVKGPLRPGGEGLMKKGLKMPLKRLKSAQSEGQITSKVAPDVEVIGKGSVDAKSEADALGTNKAIVKPKAPLKGKLQNKETTTQQLEAKKALPEPKGAQDGVKKGEIAEKEISGGKSPAFGSDLAKAGVKARPEPFLKLLHASPSTLVQLKEATRAECIGVRPTLQNTPTGPLPAVQLVNYQGEVLETIPFFLVSEVINFKSLLSGSRVILLPDCGGCSESLLKSGAQATNT
eukprot:Blabericola_migrator_1__4958@NODE_2581_length_2577_cov_12_037052_g1616_i0_p1_GENE_NODE_2581_length_2577_cov_12_037052_g1616_i0NODE_2581_length_2577_cov_12_037052_g1616_i0_p1_ORF_typecomplete_len467_score82_82_NODE_2581_length_2577_cov_12_037052_g1616_i0861402